MEGLVGREAARRSADEQPYAPLFAGAGRAQGGADCGPASAASAHAAPAPKSPEGSSARSRRCVHCAPGSWPRSPAKAGGKRSKFKPHDAPFQAKHPTVLESALLHTLQQRQRPAFYVRPACPPPNRRRVHLEDGATDRKLCVILQVRLVVQAGKLGERAGGVGLQHEEVGGRAGGGGGGRWRRGQWRRRRRQLLQALVPARRRA